MNNNDASTSSSTSCVSSRLNMNDVVLVVGGRNDNNSDNDDDDDVVDSCNNNQFFMRLLYKNQALYLKSPEPIQKTIVRDIVKEIHNLDPPGRFLIKKKKKKKCNDNDDDEDEDEDEWIVLSDEKVRSLIHKELKKERSNNTADDDASTATNKDVNEEDNSNSNNNNNTIGGRDLSELQSYVLFVPSCGCIIQNDGSNFLKRLVCERRLLFQHEYTSETTQNFLIQDIIKATKFMILSSDNNKWRSLNKDDIPLVTKVIKKMLYSSTDNIFGTCTTIVEDETDNDNTDDNETRVVTNRTAPTIIMNQNNNNIAGLCYLPISRYL